MHLRSLLALSIAATMAQAAACRAADVDWPTYGFDTLRTSNNPYETAIGPSTVKNLTELWSFNAGAFDHGLGFTASHAVLAGQPIVAAGVPTSAGTKNLVLLGDNNGVFFALDANSTNVAGSVVWYRSLGTMAVGAPVNNTFGVRGAAALDHSGSGVVYTSDNTQVFGLDLATGATLSGWPVSVVGAGAPGTDGQIHDALNFVNNQIYLGTSAVGEDTPPYYGRVSVISTLTHQVVANWFGMTGTSQQPTAYGAGVWGWGGIAVDPTAAAGGVYVATGNAVGQPQQTVYAENVVNLSPNLGSIVGAATPSMAPSGDDDYGSTPLVFTPKCGTKLLVVKNKTGQVVVETVGANGALTLVQSLLISTSGGSEFKGTAAFDPTDQLVLMTLNTVATGAPYQPGLAAFSVTCAAPYLTLAWQTTARPNGGPITVAGGKLSSPTVANGLVFFGAETPEESSKSVVYAALTRKLGGRAAGTIVWASGVVNGTFDSALPTVVNGELLFATSSPQPTLFAFGLPPAAVPKKRTH